MGGEHGSVVGWPAIAYFDVGCLAKSKSISEKKDLPILQVNE